MIRLRRETRLLRPATLARFRSGLVGALVLTLGLVACQKLRPAPPSATDMSLGSPTAPVTVIEYASVACPHCAAFNNAVFPSFRRNFIATGQVRYIAREALTGDTGLAAAGFLTARCAGRDRYFDVLDQIYRAQNAMYASGAPLTQLRAIAERAGLSQSRFEACISDQVALKALSERWAREVKVEGVSQTPTFVINGEVYTGDMSYSELSQAISRANKARAKA